MDDSLIRKTIDTGIICSNDKKNVVKIRHSLVDFVGMDFVGMDFVGMDFVGMDEVGIEVINEEEKKFKDAVWIHRKDLPRLIENLQKFV